MSALNRSVIMSGLGGNWLEVRILRRAVLSTSPQAGFLTFPEPVGLVGNTALSIVLRFLPGALLARVRGDSAGGWSP